MGTLLLSYNQETLDVERYLVLVDVDTLLTIILRLIYRLLHNGRYSRLH